MAKKIKLELTQAQFSALTSLAEDMAITIGMVNDELASSINRRVNLVNKAFDLNNLDFRINT